MLISHMEPPEMCEIRLKMHFFIYFFAENSSWKNTKFNYYFQQKVQQKLNINLQIN